MAEKIKIPFLFFLLSIMQLIHSTEEVIFRLFDRLPMASAKLHDITGFFPVLSMSGTAFLILNIIIVLLMFWLAVLVLRNNSRAIRFSIFISLIEILNGFLHLSGALIFWEYMPGCVSGIGLIILGVIYFRKSRRLTRGLVPLA